MVFDQCPQHAVEVCVAWDLSLVAVAASLNEMMQESLNVLQVLDLLDTEDDEVVPFPFVAILSVPTDAPNRFPVRPV